ncbi:Polyphosphate kinase [Parageobacillus caldoxylosilyticus]|nr:Polyphosphate kinase [Parageobacillus caldoxylosilyticus]
MEKPEFHHLSVAPFDLRRDLIKLIEDEFRFHKHHGNGRIIAKMNALTDKELIMKLYEASQADVKIDLIVRGICCLRPRIPGVSENIRVRSIVGRFLEHSRIYYFHHNGEDKIFLSSADMMTRNMEKRGEILFPFSQNI